jgi:hypothetical protein
MKARPGTASIRLKTGEPQAEQKCRRVGVPWSSPTVS